MDLDSSVAVALFLRRYRPSEAAQLLSFASARERQAIEPLLSSEISLATYRDRIQEMIHTAHRSWFQHAIAASSDAAQRFYSAAFQHPHENATPIDRFAELALYRAIGGPNHLQRRLLPSAPHNRLLDYNKSQLMQLIDLLSIYDIAPEVRQIVDPKKISALHNNLSALEKSFLQQILRFLPPGVKARPKLLISHDQPHDTRATFRKQMHKLGIVRLGYALRQDHPDLVWHVAHRLDRGRGELLLAAVQKEPSGKRSDVYSQQLHATLTFLGGPSRE